MGNTRCISPLSITSSNLLPLLRLPTSNTEILNSSIGRGPLLFSHISLSSTELIRIISAELHIPVLCLPDLVGARLTVTDSVPFFITFYSLVGYWCFLRCLSLASLNMKFSLCGRERPGESATNLQTSSFGELDFPYLGYLPYQIPFKGVG